MTDEDSYEKFKNHLVETIEMEQDELRPPKPPMNSYMRFSLERSRQERSKNPQANWIQLGRQISLEWKSLPEKEKEFYEQQSALRIKERERLLEEFNRVTKKQKLLTPYCKYFQKMFPIYQKEFPDLKAKEITVLISAEWAKLDSNKKKPYVEQAQKQKLLFNRTEIPIEDIEAYKQSVQKYNDELIAEKNKILKQYPYAKPSKMERLNAQRLRNRQIKREQKLAKKKELMEKRMERDRLVNENKRRSKEQRQRATEMRRERKRQERKRQIEERKAEKAKMRKLKADQLLEEKRIKKMEADAAKQIKKDQEKAPKVIKSKVDKPVQVEKKTIASTIPSVKPQKNQLVPKPKSSSSDSEQQPAPRPKKGPSSKIVTQESPPKKSTIPKRVQVKEPSVKKSLPKSKPKKKLATPAIEITEPEMKIQTIEPKKRVQAQKIKVEAPIQKPTYKKTSNVKATESPKRGRAVKIEHEPMVPKTKQIQKRVPRPVRKPEAEVVPKQEPRIEEKRSTRKRIGESPSVRADEAPQKQARPQRHRQTKRLG